MAKKRAKVSDQVRQAINASGLSRYFICKTISLAQATMSRFMNGQGGLSMDSLDRLADLLDLKITAGKRKDK